MSISFRSAAGSVAIAAAICACRSAPPARAPESFLRATPIVEHAPLSIDPGPPSAANEASERAPVASVLPTVTPTGVARRADVAASKAPAARPPKAVIAHANSVASQSPDENGYVNAVMTYAYEPGGFYKIFTAPWRVTDIVLEAGEELLGPVAGGDPVRWKLDVGTGAADGVPQKHLFLKPVRPGLRTNLTLTTNRRTYLLDLESLEETFMVSVRWTYPQDEQSDDANSSATPEPEAASPARAPTDLQRVHFDYSIDVINGKPTWKPRAVYDDGTHTYIRFGRKLLTGEAPALYVRERGQLQLVNFRVEGTLYMVDRLFQIAELRLGNDDDQDVVRLQRR